MKIIAIGDIHGRSHWKEIINDNMDADKIVFIGDYFDSRNGGYSANRQISNFKDILEVKKVYPDKVILLIGNHDHHYIGGVNQTYSGYQAGYAVDIREVLEIALKEGLLQLCWFHENYFFSHAGLTKTWSEQFLGNANPSLGSVLMKALNEMYYFCPRNFNFNMGENYDRSGDDVTQSPIWVRPKSLLSDMVDNIICVVGHTTVIKLGINEDIPNLILIDCLGTSGEYLIIEDGKPRSSKKDL